MTRVRLYITISTALELYIKAQSQRQRIQKNFFSASCLFACLFEHTPHASAHGYFLYLTTEVVNLPAGYLSYQW